MVCASILSSLCHSWGNFKFFSLSFLRYFGLIISCICLSEDELSSKDKFYNGIYPIPVIIWNISVGISSFLVYQSYVTVRPIHKIKFFTLTISKEQEKIKKNS